MPQMREVRGMQGWEGWVRRELVLGRKHLEEMGCWTQCQEKGLGEKTGQ